MGGRPGCRRARERDLGGWNGTKWTRVAVVNPGRRSNTLNGVATIGPSDAWAVGGVGEQLNHTLVEHWNGTKWARVAAPSPAPQFAVLTDVYARTTNDVWAVGRDGAQGHTLALHWDGHTSTHIPTPDGGKLNNELTSVTVISAGNACASRDFGNQAGHPLLEHWNGTRWQLAHLPKGGGVLISVSAASATDIWSVGGFFPTTPRGTNFTPLGEHWNGSSWRVSSPPASHKNGVYNDVVAISHTDVWAVGGANSPGPGRRLRLRRTQTAPRGRWARRRRRAGRASSTASTTSRPPPRHGRPEARRQEASPTS